LFKREWMEPACRQEIADKAGINKALLHYYFRSKQKLFDAIFKKVFSKILPNIMTMVQSDLPIEKKLEVFIENYINVLIKNPFLPTFILKEMSRDPEFMANIIKGNGVNPQEVLHMFRKEMEKGNIRTMDPRDLIINILSLSIFPIASKPLMTVMFFDKDKIAYKEFIERRKITVKEFILNSILIK